MVDAIDTIETAAARYTGGNDLYNAYRDQWTYLLEAFVGGQEWREGHHLQKYLLENDGEYSNRLYNTPYENHCASIISVYNSFIFKTPPNRELGNLKNVPFMEDFLRDADHDGRSLNAFMKDVATYASIFGHAWIMVSKPDVGATTLAEELEMGVRPYLSMLSPINVLDWRWTRSITGKYELEYFRYIEEVNGDVVTVREWTPTEIKTIVTHDDTITQSYSEPNGLGKIPAVCVYNQRSVIRGIGKSDIADIADASRYIYNMLSEIEQSVRLDSHPSLAATQDTILGNGPGSIIQMPTDLDPGLKPYVVQANGGNIANILNTIEHTIGAIDKMASLGAMRATESTSMSGVAMQTEFQMLGAKLAEKADSLELAEEQMWRLIAEYAGVPYDCWIEYPDSFGIRDKAMDLDFLIKARTSGVNNEKFQEEINRQIVELVVQDDETAMAINEVQETFEPHIMVDPDTGEQVMAQTEADHLRLAAEGWIHQ